LPQNQKHNYIEYILTKNINSNLHHHRIISYSVIEIKWYINNANITLLNTGNYEVNHS